MGYVTIDIGITTSVTKSSSYKVDANIKGVTNAYKHDREASEEISIDLEEWKDLGEVLKPLDARPRGIAEETKVKEFGKNLFQQVIKGTVYALYKNGKAFASNRGFILRLRLHLGLPELIELPWELLREEGLFLGLATARPRILIVRCPIDIEPIKAIEHQLPLQIMIMAAEPKDWPTGAKEEKERIREVLKGSEDEGYVSLKEMRGTDIELESIYKNRALDIFHFIGHGNFNEATREGELILEDALGNTKSIPAQKFSLSLPNSVKLVFLNACESARGNAYEAYSSIAHILAKQGYVVIAMQFQISIKAAIRFAAVFYSEIAKSTPVDQAVTEARQRVFTMSDCNLLDWAAPVLYMKSDNGVLFKIEEPAIVEDGGNGGLVPAAPDKPPVTLPSPSNPGQTTEELLPERGTAIDPPVPKLDEPVPSKGLSRLFFLLSSFFNLIHHRFYLLLASILILTLVLGCVFSLPFVFHSASSDFFPPLCSGNFQAASTQIPMIPTPATSISPDGEPIGLSEGAKIFDLQRSKPDEVQDKVQAAQDIATNPQDVESSLARAIGSDQTDAEAQIYRANWKVLQSSHPYITIVVGVSFASTYTGESRGALQGAFIAQKECNDQNQQSGRMQIVLMIANIGGKNSPNNPAHANFVANQIVDQAAKDKTIVGIMGWPNSADTINVNYQLKARNSTLPMVAPSSSSDDLEGMSHFFRVCPPNKEQAQMAANFMLNTKRKKRIVILYDQTNSYSNNLETDVSADIPNNPVRSENFIGGNSKTLQDALTKALAQKPDAIFFSGYVSDLVELLNDISSIPQANNLLIVGGDALATTNDYNTLPPGLNNVYFTAFASPNEWDKTNPKPPFFREYKDDFGTPLAPTGLSSMDIDVLLGYDAMLTLLDGSQQVLSTQNSITSSDLIRALKQINSAKAIQGITGRIAFKDNGDPQGKRIILEHIQGTSLKVDDSQGCLQKDNCSL